MNGNYDDVNKLASEIAGEEDGWAFVNVNVRPYYAEGSKTLGYEIAEQLGWRLPDQVVIPVASGSQLTKVDKAFQELIKLGLVEDKPYKIYGAQATGCSPVSVAYKDGVDAIRPVKPDTIAKSLAIGNPADGIYVLDICRRTGGAVEDITDEQVRDGIVLLARTEGIFTETAGGTTVGVLKKLVETGQLDPRWRPSSSTPVTGSRPSTRSPTRSDRSPPSTRTTPPSPRPASRRTTSERFRPRPHDPAHLHRWRVGGQRLRRDPGGSARRPGCQLHRHQGPGPRRRGQPAPLRERVRRQRRRPLPRQPRHGDARGHPDLGDPGGRGRVLTLRRLVTAVAGLAAVVALGVAGPAASAPAERQVAVEQGPAVTPFELRASDNARLRAAWKRWVMARTPHYATRVERSCGECPAPPPVVRTEVRRGRLVSVRTVPDGEPATWRQAQPMDRLYRLLRKAHREAEDVFVRYSKRGVPLSIAINWSDLIADEETYLSVRARTGL